MIIGVPKEIKDHEYRIGMVPSGMQTLLQDGHQVLVEKGAGAGISLADSTLKELGVTVVDTAEIIFKNVDLVVKVKEPQLEEIELFKPFLTVASFLHLAPEPEITAALIEKKITGIAYETIEGKQGGLPVLRPMSAAAGKVAVQAGAHLLTHPAGGSGLLLGGVPGSPKGVVVIVGAGTVGSEALKIAVGMGARVLVLDIDTEKLAALDDLYGNRIETIFASQYNLGNAVAQADLLIGAVLVTGAAAPQVITANMIKRMRVGSVFVDVAIDQGGCSETSKPTTHSHPTYLVDEIIHYCVTNIPGAVPLTSTYALAHASIPYIRSIAKYGVPQVFKEQPGLAAGVNLYQGKLTCFEVAEALDLEYSELALLL